MFKPARKLVFRLLLCVAAMVGSAAIGASTLTAQPTDVAGPHPATDHSPALVASPPVRVDKLHVATQAVDSSLIARADNLDLMAATYRVEYLDTALTAPPPIPASRTETGQGFEWPRPSPWTSALATLALGAFFFLRRIV